jgi:protein-export membrane protein SecD
MNNRTITSYVLILLLALVALYIVVPSNYPQFVRDLLAWRPTTGRALDFRLGLDLQGGLQVLMVADMPPGEDIPPGGLETARQIVDRRVNALGLTEPLVQIQGTERIIVEIPGIQNPEQAVDTIRETALLEFAQPPPEYTQAMLFPGMPVRTTYGEGDLDAADIITETPEFETILTGADLKQAVPQSDPQTGQFIVLFELQADARSLFAEYTRNHLNQPLCIILDKTILSCPIIQNEIPDGQGQITGGFTADSARQLAIQLQYGALPVPLKIESYRSVGPTLGQISVQNSIRAGVIGLVVVLLFMLVYYRLNGLAADLALALYVLLNLMLYKLIPVTMTLPGIAGFLLSAGMAVDANILVFERMKEELRSGRSLSSAIEAGFARAWTSVRDSNLATLLTCAILYFFGNAFAASLVKGFAVTLALGTVLNLFTAVLVTRTLVRVVFGLFGEQATEHSWLLGT